MKTVKANGAMNREIQIDFTEIAERAYALWCAAGRPEGRDPEFWPEAEAEVRAARRGRGLKAGKPQHSDENGSGDAPIAGGKDPWKTKAISMRTPTI
jgi:Protein of unknown function (DUF2934)